MQQYLCMIQRYNNITAHFTYIEISVWVYVAIFKYNTHVLYVAKNWRTPFTNVLPTNYFLYTQL